MKINWFKSGSFLKIPNKFWEVQLANFPDSDNIFNFQFRLNRNCDHAGLNFTIEIWTLYFCVQVYDNRHWDYENNCYINPTKN